MEMNLTKNLDYVMDCCSDEIGASLLESYIYTYIKKYINKEKVEGDIVVFLGNLSYLYGRSDITDERVESYINKLTSIIPYIDRFLCEHISNFIEMVLVHKPELIEHYIAILEHNMNYDSNNNSILYSAVVIASLRNKIDLEKILCNCEYTWDSYFKMANYYLYYNNKTKSLNCIIKALKSCPKELEEKYRRKEKYIISEIKRDIL